MLEFDRISIPIIENWWFIGFRLRFLKFYNNCYRIFDFFRLVFVIRAIVFFRLVFVIRAYFEIFLVLYTAIIVIIVFRSFFIVFRISRVFVVTLVFVVFQVFIVFRVFSVFIWVRFIISNYFAVTRYYNCNSISIVAEAVTNDFIRTESLACGTATFCKYWSVYARYALPNYIVPFIELIDVISSTLIFFRAIFIISHTADYFFFLIWYIICSTF